MKRILFALFLIFGMHAAFGQAVRVDPTNAMTPGAQPPNSGLPQLFAVPFATVTLCGSPANANPCTNFAQTYTDTTEAVACPMTSQVVLNGTSTCGPITDGGGAFGFWVTPGNYTYMLQDANGNSYGPYFLSAPAAVVTGFLPIGGGTLTGPLNLPIGTPTGQQAVSAAALAASLGNYLQKAGSAFTNLNGINAVSSTIAAAVTAAGSVGGSVLIPATYTGVDSWTNSYNVGFVDYRAHNPLNLIQQTNPVPQNTLYATDYGVLADGFHDDTANLQAAAWALRARCGGTGGGSTYMCPGVLELPQGRIEISAPIVLADYGSVHCNGTWILPLEPWLGTGLNGGDLFQVTTSYFPSGAHSSPGTHGIGISPINRFVDGCNFEYNYNVTAHAAIHEFSGYGHTTTQPYPASNTQFANYQIPQVRISNNSVYAMDTAFNIEDCGECLVDNNQVNFVRVGIVDGGNNYALVLRNNVVQAGTWSYTSVANRTNPTWGLFSTLETRYACSNSVQNCAGEPHPGSPPPQGLEVIGDDFEQFDNDIYVSNIQGMTLDGGASDFSGYGPYAQANPSFKEPSMYFAAGVIQVEIDNYYCANTNVNQSPCIEIGAPSVNASNGAGAEQYNGAFTISNSYFDSYNNGGAAIQYDSGNFIRKGDTIYGNKFINWAFAVLMNHPLQDSVIRDNYLSGGQSTSAMIDFNASAYPFTGTVVENNTTPNSEPAVLASSGTGWRTGFNQSATQLTGSQTATGTGVSIAGGTVGTLSTAVTMSLPSGYAFADTAYTITGCVLQGATGAAHITLVGGSGTGSSFSVYEATDTTSAVSGGQIFCTVTHP